MLRRSFLGGGVAALVAGRGARETRTKLARAAKAQLGVTTGYDPGYSKIAYPGGDVPRSTGVCADVVVRASRDGLGLDLQRLVHEDMVREFAAYPKTWGLAHASANIDHRRVLNLEVFWRRAGAQKWMAQGKVAGDDFPGPLEGAIC